MRLIEGRFESLRRHLAVLREAWRQESQAAKDRRPRAEHEFLPAALEIIEKPASPGLRLLLLTLCSLFALAVLWSVLGRIDVMAVAPGKTVPAGNVKLVQPIEAGTVRAIHVRNGQRVTKGQLLIELDATIAGADEAQASRGLLEARIDEARGDALLAHLRGTPAGFRAPPGTPADVAETQAGLIRSVIAEYEAERASLLQSRAEAAASLAATEAELAKLRQTLPLVEQQLAARRDLTEKGHFSKLKLLEYEQLRLEHLRNIDIQQSGAAKGQAAIANIDAQLARLHGTFGKTAATEVAAAEGEAGMRTEELTKSARRRLYQKIVSPVDGVVQQIAVHTVGGVVQPAQALMVVVPDESELVVEAQILNRDIGFIREGQPVRIKVEAFPFTDFGIVEGVVDTISRDAVQEEGPQGEAGKAAGSSAGLVYKARIRLRRDHLVIAGRRQPLGPGMAVQAEIKTGRRRIIQYLLSPISRAADEAGRER